MRTTVAMAPRTPAPARWVTRSRIPAVSCQCFTGKLQRGFYRRDAHRINSTWSRAIWASGRGARRLRLGEDRLGDPHVDPDVTVDQLGDLHVAGDTGQHVRVVLRQSVLGGQQVDCLPD